MNGSQLLIDHCIAGFRQHHKRDPERVAFAPGRVNLIGEHTDYNGGFVFPCALPIGTAVAVARRDDSQIGAVALDLDQQDAFDLEDIAILPEGHWGNHLRGVVSALPLYGFDIAGADVAIAGNIPQGSGLSSSASLGVAAGLALSVGNDGPRERMALAKAAQWAEHNFVGSACGMMDQLASVCGVENSALLIDCRSLDTQAVPMPGNAVVITIHSGVTRELADSAYNERRLQCEAAARYFGVTALRDLDTESLQRGRAELDETLYRRARHVVTENARTLSAQKALMDGDLKQFGHLMRQSHISLRDDFEVTVPAIDALFEVMSEAIGTAGGVRMTGGGFGGCLVAVLSKDRVPALTAAVERYFQSSNLISPFSIKALPAKGAYLINL